MPSSFNDCADFFFLFFCAHSWIVFDKHTHTHTLPFQRTVFFCSSCGFLWQRLLLNCFCWCFCLCVCLSAPTCFKLCLGVHVCVCVCVWMPVNQVWLYFVPQNTVSNCGKKHTFFFFFFWSLKLIWEWSDRCRVKK